MKYSGKVLYTTFDETLEKLSGDFIEAQKQVVGKYNRSNLARDAIDYIRYNNLKVKEFDYPNFQAGIPVHIRADLDRTTFVMTEAANLNLTEVAFLQKVVYRYIKFKEEQANERKR